MKGSSLDGGRERSALPCAGTFRSAGLWFSMFNRAARSLFLLAAFVGLQGSVMLSAPCASGVHLSDSSTLRLDRALQVTAHAHSKQETAESSLPHEASRGMPCEHESMPEGCMLMAACTAFVPALATQLNEPVAPSGKGMVLVVRTPAFESVAPDVPPPRVVRPTT